MKLVYLLPLLIVFVLTPAFAYNSGFRPIYQPNLPGGGSNATELYCTLGQFLNSYNSTTNSFTCAAGGGGGENNTASSSGVGYSLVLPKVGVDLPFRGIFCAGDLLCSSNSTDIRISYDTPASSSLKVNNQSAQNDFQITGINNVTGVITTNQFSVNTITCSGSDVVSSIDNVTGYVTCVTPSGGSGFDTIASSPQTTATILADNSTITNTATIKTLTQGTGITLTNGSNAVTVAINFKVDSNLNTTNGNNDSFLTGFDNVTGDFTRKQFVSTTTTCSGTNKFSAYDNRTGVYTCSADVSGGGTAREDLVGQFEVDRTWTNIGVNYVDTYATAEGVRIDTNGMTTATFEVLWTKVGAGTQRCQIVDATNAANILIVLNGVVSGINTNATQTIPAGLVNTIKTYEPQCMSTTSTDDPVWLSGTVLLRP